MTKTEREIRRQAQLDVLVALKGRLKGLSSSIVLPFISSLLISLENKTFYIYNNYLLDSINNRIATLVCMGLSRVAALE